MFFANGQNFMVILRVAGEDYIMHEPIGLIPRYGDVFTYAGKRYLVSDVAYQFPVRPVHKKMRVYLSVSAVA